MCLAFPWPQRHRRAEHLAAARRFRRPLLSSPLLSSPLLSSPLLALAVFRVGGPGYALYVHVSISPHLSRSAAAEADSESRRHLLPRGTGSAHSAHFPLVDSRTYTHQRVGFFSVHCNLVPEFELSTSFSLLPSVLTSPFCCGPRLIEILWTCRDRSLQAAI